MTIVSGGGDGAKRQRVDKRGVRREAVAADAISVDRILTLPDELRQRILTRLPFKDAIRTGALARGWRDLWKTRWPHRASVEVPLGSPDAARRKLDALSRKPRRRLDSFSLVIKNCKLKSWELRAFTDYAAECGVEDLHVEVRRGRLVAAKLHFPTCSPLLARLSLRRVGIISSPVYYKGAQPFRALEVIRLRSVSITEVGFKNMMALCPSLLTLNLRLCDCDCFFNLPDSNSKKRSLVMPPNLRTVTIADCLGVANLVPVPSLRSFCYRGDFVNSPFILPSDAGLGDLYIRFADSVAKLHNTRKLRNSLPKDLSGLNVLTICSNALEVASCLLPNINLPNLRELQLIMLEMEASNLAELCVFFKTFQCPNLERLFVQLPTSSGDKPMEGGSFDEVREEPPEDSLDNLLMVKVINFNWRRSEVQLVSFLLTKTSSLRKLLIVSPNVTPPPDLPCVEADLLLIKEALANGKIILGESNDATAQPFHSKVFIMV